MSTLSVGLDVVNTERFATQLADEASGFVDGTFTGAEQKAAEGPRRAERLAVRFAAKEAFVKAWSSARSGRTPTESGVNLREIEVVDDGYGRPGIHLHGAAADAIGNLAKEIGVMVRIHVSLSHDPPVASAVVVLDA